MRIAADYKWKNVLVLTEDIYPGDGLRHYGYQKTGQFYNGVTQDDIYKPESSARVANVNGIQGQPPPLLPFYAC